MVVAINRLKDPPTLSKVVTNPQPHYCLEIYQSAHCDETKIKDDLTGDVATACDNEDVDTGLISGIPAGLPALVEV